VAGALSRRRIRADIVVMVSRSTFVAAIVLGLFVLVGAATGNGGLASSGVLGATILAALGVQDILRNYVSGIYMLTESRFKPGDEIVFSGSSGKIIEIRFRVTYVEADDGSLIVVPNAELFNSIVTIKSTARREDASEPQPATAAATRRRRG
jgi:small-conductance mechanosensitive channel